MVKDETSSDITVSLEWAKKLKEAGWLQDGALFCWWLRIGHTEYELSPAIFLKNGEFAAPTAEEILRRLPVYFTKGNEKRVMRIMKHEDGRYSVFYESYAIKTGMGELPYYDIPEIKKHDTLANASASMYCYLAENNLLPSS